MLAAKLPNGPDPAMIYPMHCDRLSRVDPEAADGAPAPFWHVNAAWTDTLCEYVCLKSHTSAKAEEHSTAQHSTVS